MGSVRASTAGRIPGKFAKGSPMPINTTLLGLVETMKQRRNRQKCPTYTFTGQFWNGRNVGYRERKDLTNLRSLRVPIHVISKQLQTQKVPPWQTDFLANSDALHHLHHAVYRIQNENPKTDPKRHQTCLWHDGNAMALS